MNTSEIPTNLFAGLPRQLHAEQFDTLLSREGLRIERILSLGHSSPVEGWYDQAENEWVVVLQGRGTLAFEDGRQVELGPGDHILIPAHQRHRVVSTDPDQITLWLAVFYP